MRKTAFLLPTLICLQFGVNLLGESLIVHPTSEQVASAQESLGMYAPGLKSVDDYVDHSRENELANFAESLKQDAALRLKRMEEMRAKQGNALLDEQKRQAEIQRQRELASSRAIKQCNGGNMHMCFLVGNGYKRGGCTINNTYAHFGYDDFKAVQFFTKACNGGDIQGCSALGSMYNEGKGTPQNKDKAAQLLTKACNANDATACNNLGVMYQNGYGMWGNKSKAKELYSKACQLRSQAGCSNYANLNK